jgi:phage/plasmid-like protein (TIGR03299 family)
MPANVESMAYALAGGVPWHREGIPVSNDMTVDGMLDAAGLRWTTSKRHMYFPKRTDDGKTVLKIVPDEFALVRDTDETVLDTVGPNYIPVQNEDIFGFFKRFVEAGDMQLETAGSLKGGRFIWALARFNDSFKVGKDDEHRGYILLSQPHQFGFSLTAALTPVRVVCWNTLNYALGSGLDGSASSVKASFRMVHSREFDDNVKAQAEAALGLAHNGMKAFSHTAQVLSEARATDGDVIDYFHEVFKIEREDDTEEAQLEQEKVRSATINKLSDILISAPGQDMNTTKGTWFGAMNACTYFIDHVRGGDDNRLYTAWYGPGAAQKRRAVDMALEYAKVAA